LDSSAAVRDARGLQFAELTQEFDLGSGFFVADCLVFGLETPMLIRRKPNPLRSISINRMAPSPRPLY
jgi:hypothetical protein